MDNKKSPVLKVVGIIGTIIFILAVITAFYMMYHGMGLLEGFDFGAGQYYYTDIPGWQKYFVPDYYENHWIIFRMGISDVSFVDIPG